MSTPSQLGSYPVERELGRGRLLGVVKGTGEDDPKSWAIVLNWLDRVKSKLPAR